MSWKMEYLICARELIAIACHGGKLNWGFWILGEREGGVWGGAGAKRRGRGNFDHTHGYLLKVIVCVIGK